jgi:hypothetical protein
VPTVDEYVAAGLYAPGDPLQSGRVELLDWLTEQGSTLDDVNRWVMRDAVSGVAGDRRMVAGERHDRATAIARSGLAPDDFDAYSTAVGFMPIQGAPPGEVGYTDDEIDTLSRDRAARRPRARLPVRPGGAASGEGLRRTCHRAVTRALNAFGLRRRRRRARR